MYQVCYKYEDFMLSINSFGFLLNSDELNDELPTTVVTYDTKEQCILAVKNVLEDIQDIQEKAVEKNDSEIARLKEENAELQKNLSELAAEIITLGILLE